MTDLWRAARVRRYHTVPQVGEQTVADHSWGVAMILLRLMPAPGPTVGLLRAALQHDLTEAVTGDVPATAKWAYPQLKLELDTIEADQEVRLGIVSYLSGEERDWLKAADLLELCFWCQYQYRLGNNYAMEVLKRGLVALKDNPRTPKEVVVKVAEYYGSGGLRL